MPYGRTYLNSVRGFAYSPQRLTYRHLKSNHRLAYLAASSHRTMVVPEC